MNDVADAPELFCEVMDTWRQAVGMMKQQNVSQFLSSRFGAGGAVRAIISRAPDMFWNNWVPIRVSE